MRALFTALLFILLLAVNALAVTTYSNDTFTEGSDTALSSHTAETGGSWTRHPNFAATATVQASTDRVVGDSGSTAIYYHAATPSNADYDVTATLRASDLSTGLPGVIGRMNTSASTFYQAYISDSSTLTLAAVVAGSTVASTTKSFSFSTNTNYTVTLRMRGTRIEVIINSQSIVGFTDSNITATGKAGLRTRDTGSVDNFVVTDDTIQNDVVIADGLWTWFTNPRVIYDSGKYYLGSITGGGTPHIDSYDSSSGALKTFYLHSSLETDDHDNPAPIILPNGKIAAFYSTHSTSGDTSGTRYRVSTSAGDMSAFDSEQTLGAGQTEPTAYSNPFYVSAASKIALFYRSGLIGVDTAQLGLRTAATDLSSWDSEILICKGRADSDVPYFRFAQNGSDRIDVLATDLHPSSGTSSVYHFYVKWDSGSSAFKYYKTDGTEITATKPWRVNSEASLIYDGSSERAWIWDIRIDSNGYPRVIFTRFPSTTDHRYYFARWNGSAWTTPVQIAVAGNPLYVAETYYSGGASFDGNDPNIAYLSVESSGTWEIQEWRSADDGATWSKHTDITSGSGSTFKRARPYSPNGHDGAIGVAYWSSIYTSFTSWTDGTIKRFQNVTATATAPNFFTRRRVQ